MSQVLKNEQEFTKIGGGEDTKREIQMGSIPGREISPRRGTQTVEEMQRQLG